jgi:signal transduction histidine kinase
VNLAQSIAGLKKSAPDLRKLIDALPSPVWLVAPDGVAEFRNAAWRGLVGLDETAVRTWLDLAVHEDRNGCEIQWLALQASGKNGVIATRLRHTDGERRRVVVDVAPAHDAAGAFLGWCCSASHTNPDAANGGQLDEGAVLLDVCSRLIDENAALRGQVEALARTLDAVAGEASPEKLVEHILRTLTEKLDAHSVTVWSRDKTSGLIAFEGGLEHGQFGGRDEDSDDDRRNAVPLSDIWPCEPVFRTGRPVVVEDIRTLAPFRWQDRLVALGVVTILFGPMSIAGTVTGMIALRFKAPRTFRPDEVELAQTLANQAMLSMQVARLAAETRRAAVIAERNRLARDIHDTVAQGFTGVIVQLRAAEDARSQGLAEESDDHLMRAADVARDSLQEARRCVQALRPLALQDRDLSDALSLLFEKMTRRTKVRTSISVIGTMPALPADWEDNLVRIGQEALTNVLRHANARMFSARLVFNSTGLDLELQDDGRGFDASAKSDGLGLLGMRERVESMGGTLRIDSSPGTGSIVRVRLPRSALPVAMA